MEKSCVNVRDYVIVDEHSNIIGSNIGTVRELIGSSQREHKNKNKGFITHMIYDEIESKELEDFIRAFISGELYLKYQPQYDINTMEIVGVEALLRWDNRGVAVSPNCFIKIAEEIGLIKDVGKRVIDEACYQLSLWKRVGVQRVVVAVNVSVAQLKDFDIVEDLKNAMDKHDVCPCELIIEITESCSTEGIPEYIEIINKIQELGVKTSIDDFGMGYSSLRLLKEVKIDSIKIDKYFVDDITTNISIVKHIIELAKSYGITTTAEGVETIEQLDILRELGCDIIQGYIFSEAVLPEEIKFVNIR